jgi:hypothetical protein
MSERKKAEYQKYVLDMQSEKTKKEQAALDKHTGVLENGINDS